jgi:ubiquinone/menaquinone biosynthesis C-methylase UbiE
MRRSHHDRSAGNRRFVPAFQFRALGRFYDPAVRALGADVLRSRLIELVEVEPGERVLDVGCGTGTLLLAIKAAQPGAEVVGVDPDPDILSIARAKAVREGAEISFEVGFADGLPHADGSFDRVVSTLAFHHLTRREKQDALAEAFRVLKPGGRLHIVDICKPGGMLMRALTLPLAGDERTTDNRAGRVPQFIADAGFVDSSDCHRTNRIFGTVCFHQARRPAPGARP